MRYLQAVVEAETQQRLFKKDFQAHKIFTVLTQLWATSLIGVGLLRSEDIYNAFIVPRYGPFQRLSYPAKLHSHVYEKTLRINLDYQEPLQPNLAIDFFSVGVWIPQFPNPYWANFQIHEIHYFWKNIEEALIHAHIATPMTKFQHKLYARDDSQANFEREELAPSTHQQEQALLIEVTSIEDISSE